jgi:hypothetical protein
MKVLVNGNGSPFDLVRDSGFERYLGEIKTFLN